MFGNDCNEILGSERLIDFERLDRVSREGTTGKSEASFTRENIPLTLRSMFDHALNKIMSGSCRVFDKAVKHWAMDHNSEGNKAMFMQCLERAGWTQADSRLTRFMS